VEEKEKQNEIEISEEQFIAEMAEIFDIFARADFEYRKQNGLGFNTGSIDPASMEPMLPSN